MQFRTQGKKLQCIRSTYDPATKRSHQKVVAAFSRWADKYSSDEVAELTPAELAELDEYLAKKNAELHQARLNHAVWNATRAEGELAKLAEAIGTVESLTDEQAAAIWAGLAAVGNRRPRKKPRQHPKGRGICWAVWRHNRRYGLAWVRGRKGHPPTHRQAWGAP